VEAGVTLTEEEEDGEDESRRWRWCRWREESASAGHCSSRSLAHTRSSGFRPITRRLLPPGVTAEAEPLSIDPEERRLTAVLVVAEAAPPPVPLPVALALPGSEFLVLFDDFVEQRWPCSQDPPRSEARSVQVTERGRTRTRLVGEGGCDSG